MTDDAVFDKSISGRETQTAEWSTGPRSHESSDCHQAFSAVLCSP